MTDFVHVYDMKGRCLRSASLRPRPTPADAASAAGVPDGLRNALLDLGVVLRHWERVERAGLASISGGGDAIVRIKPDGMQRDMRAAGVAQTIEAIRRDGVEIDRFEAWLMRVDDDARGEPAAA